MTENNDKIMAEYRNADFNKRLSMYLQWPRLRSEFIQIDRRELQTESSAGIKLRKPSILVQLSNTYNSIAFGVKKVFGHASA